jgi:hypothetical protein
MKLHCFLGIDVGPLIAMMLPASSCHCILHLSPPLEAEAILVRIRALPVRSTDSFTLNGGPALEESMIYILTAGIRTREKLRKYEMSHQHTTQNRAEPEPNTISKPTKINQAAQNKTAQNHSTHLKSCGPIACTTDVPSINLVRKIRFAFPNMPSFKLTTIN